MSLSIFTDFKSDILKRALNTLPFVSSPKFCKILGRYYSL